MRFIKPVFALIIVLSVVAFFMDQGIEDNEEAVAFCENEPERAREILDFWTENDVILGVSEAVMEIDELRWNEIERDLQVAIGISAWCEYAISAYGGHTVVLNGFWDGNTIASIVNGHYVDGPGT